MTDKEQDDSNELDIEARELSIDKAQGKLLDLVEKSPTYEVFKAKLSNNLWWYLGEPMPDPYKSWTWANFEEFYRSNKK